jgi:hypothetical protein
MWRAFIAALFLLITFGGWVAFIAIRVAYPS